MGGPKGWGPKKKVANAEIYVIFEVFAFCGGRTKTDFKDRGESLDFHPLYLYPCPLHSHHLQTRADAQLPCLYRQAGVLQVFLDGYALSLTIKEFISDTTTPISTEASNTVWSSQARYGTLSGSFGTSPPSACS